MTKQEQNLLAYYEGKSLQELKIAHDKYKNFALCLAQKCEIERSKIERLYKDLQSAQILFNNASDVATQLRKEKRRIEKLKDGKEWCSILGDEEEDINEVLADNDKAFLEGQYKKLTTLYNQCINYIGPQNNIEEMNSLLKTGNSSDTLRTERDELQQQLDDLKSRISGTKGKIVRTQQAIKITQNNKDEAIKRLQKAKEVIAKVQAIPVKPPAESKLNETYNDDDSGSEEEYEPRRNYGIARFIHGVGNVVDDLVNVLTKN